MTGSVNLHHPGMRTRCIYSTRSKIMVTNPTPLLIKQITVLQRGYVFRFIIMLLGYFVKTHVEEDTTESYSYLKGVLRSQTPQSYLRKILSSRVALKM
jgi:hypothetical protein